jgi:membrane fusion protein (multidrug efflux system)
MADPALKTNPEPAAKPADPVLKVVPPPAAVNTRATRMVGVFRQYRRPILLIVLPALAFLVGLGFYLMGGRYISTDNAYVGAQKVLITPDVAGKVTKVLVREGQRVNAGDTLFEIDPEPYRLTLVQAQAKLLTVQAQYDQLKANVVVLTRLAELAMKNVALKQRDVDRKNELVAKGSGSQVDLDNSSTGYVTSQLQSQLALQRKEDALAQLLGNPDLPLKEFPGYIQAQAAVEQAQRDLNHTKLVAPIAGIATQVDNIQLGRFVTAGAPILSVVDDAAPWVEANPKETDITYLRVGQRVKIHVDTFPDHPLQGTVMAVSPGTGAQFSILPAQNASGNWIKIVQRVPVRIAFDRDTDTRLLRSGMSATVDIDTGRNRSLLTLLGLSHPTMPPVKAATP